MTPRKPLFERLPEIYRIRDTEQTPPGQLEAYVGVVDRRLSARARRRRGALPRPVHRDLRRLGRSLHRRPARHLASLGRSVDAARRCGAHRAASAPQGHARRDRVARLALSRLGGARGRDARAALLEPASQPSASGRGRRAAAHRSCFDVSAPVRGGTVELARPGVAQRCSAGPFDPFAHVVDLKPPRTAPGFNLPESRVFLWRLKAYTRARSQAAFLFRPRSSTLTPVAAGDAAFAVRFDLHPMGEPMVLFNTRTLRADDDPPILTASDAVPGPMPAARLTQDTPAGRPDRVSSGDVLYVRAAAARGADTVGLVLASAARRRSPRPRGDIRGANLCAWENGPACRRCASTRSSIDPERGRLLFGVAGANRRRSGGRCATTCFSPRRYGFSGPTGAHPVSAPRASAAYGSSRRRSCCTGNFHDDPLGLQHALDDLPTAGPAADHRDPGQHDARSRPHLRRRHRRRGRAQGAALAEIAVDPRGVGRAAGDPAEAAARVPADVVTGAAARR